MICILCSIASSYWTLGAVALVYAVYRWGTATFDHFARRGIAFVRPWPLVGNFEGIVSRKRTFHDFVLDGYNAYANEPYVGMWQFRDPLLVLRDPALIKRLCVREFDSFANHRDTLFTERVEPLMGKSLFMLRDQKWRDMRSTLSPAFTGAKMRHMFRLIVDCAQSAGDHLMAEARGCETAADGGRPFVPELKDVFTRCMTDVIATTAFGQEVNSLVDRDNLFFEHGRQSTQLTAGQMYRGMFIHKFPRLAKLLGLSFFAPAHREFYRRLVVDTMHHRQAHGIHRPDMIQLLLEAKRGALQQQPDSDQPMSEDRMGFATVSEETASTTARPRTAKRVWDDEDFTAQSFLFFLAGFETSSTLMCVCLHELMENADVQRRLRDEVDAVRAELAAADGAPLTYERLQRMEYLDQVVSETLRKWPPAVATDRQCSRRFELPADDPVARGRRLVLERGEAVLIPILGIHRDAQYWPDPMRFDPERFSAARRARIDPQTYMPFGVGPRNCIASRFALMQVKCFVFEMLARFELCVAETSVIPLRLHQVIFTITAVGGYNVHLKPRVAETVNGG